MADEELLVFNGINGATGEYELPPMKPADIAAVALHEQISEELLRTLQDKHEQQEAHYGVNADVTDLSQTGWGVIFAAKDKNVDGLREALQPLLDWRKSQAGEYYKEFSGADGYRPGDSHLDFLKRQKMGPGPADPTKVPYYLLLVGDPEQLPYRFQFALDVQYAVGRIHFDTLEEYAQYAASVVEAEKSGVKLPRRAAFFGTQSPNDRATTLSARQLVRPLSNELKQKLNQWEIKTYIAEQAHKAQLAHLLGGDETPAFLFSASHGMGFPKGDPRQLRHQGALLCSDWPGPGQWRKPIPESFYFSADDLGSDARLAGMLAFFFACYGAGTPKLDEFAHQALHERAEIAPHAFVANLPRRMLSHPKGGALAVVGHVERAWGYSFMWSDAGRQLTVFEDTLEQLLGGYPIGAAMEWFNERYAELSVVLTNEIEEINEYGKKRDDVKLAGMWTANKDARSYIILGDPAVRLPVAQANEEPTARPVITLSEEQRKKLTNPAAPVTAFAESAPSEPQPDFAVAFGLGDQFANLQDSLRSFTKKLADALDKAADDIMTLEVKTYTTGALDKVTMQDETQAKLRALTYISFDGDMKVYVPEKSDGGVDLDLWQVHLDVVREAQANRAKFIASMADMAASLLKSFK